MTITDQNALLNAEPLGMTQKELLLRLDARFDRHVETEGTRIRVLEDARLSDNIARQTLMRVIGVAVLAVPLLTTIALRVIFPPI